MLDAHAHVMQVKLCKANTRGVTKVEKANTGKVRRGGARLVSYLYRERTKWSGDEIEEVSLESRHS